MRPLEVEDLPGPHQLQDPYGLVEPERRRSPQDRRRSIVGLTDAGRARTGQAEEARLAAERRFPAPPDEQTTATHIRAQRALPPGR
ncbi:hypothetical protein [Streptomyces sp. NPDC047061]|uniref:hypothetical protein n=1 Tax=Streptomyces sp. NPDC047061 TaxID=3154605 RepID=UPI0033F9EA73